MLQCIKGIYPTKVKYIFRTANTVAEFKYCLKKLKQINKANDDFCVLFLCGHGEPGKIHFGEDSLSLEQLAEASMQIKENLFSGHLIQFDSCSVVKGTENRIKKFMKLTGASYVTGFRDDVDFIESLAFEMIFIDFLSNHKNIEEAIKDFSAVHSSLCEKLKFRIISSL